jgi:hypothetical protein
LSSKLDKSDMREQRSGRVRLLKKREVKTYDDVVNLAQAAQACSECSGELLRAQGAQVARVSCSGYSGELTEPRVISA